MVKEIVKIIAICELKGCKGELELIAKTDEVISDIAGPAFINAIPAEQSSEKRRMDALPIRQKNTMSLQN